MENNQQGGAEEQDDTIVVLPEDQVLDENDDQPEEHAGVDYENHDPPEVADMNEAEDDFEQVPQVDMNRHPDLGTIPQPRGKFQAVVSS